MTCRRMASLATVLSLAMVGSVIGAPSKLPVGLKTCKTDEGLNTCLKTAVTDAFSIVAKGIPSLSIPSIDPLDIKKLEIGEGTGPVKVNLEFNDVQLIGLKDAWVETIKANLDDFAIEGRIRFHGPIRINGPYKVSGSVLVLPIVGDGMTNITLNDLIADISITGDHYTKGGDAYVKIKTFDLSLTVKHLSLAFTNLFNGDKALGDTMNKFLNENWQEIFKELQPAFEVTLGAIFKQITAQFFRKIPFKLFFPSD